MSKVVIIADASCLIALHNIQELELLNQMYGDVRITPEVEKEFGEKLPNWITVEVVEDPQKISLLELELDKGEASAIALSLQYVESQLVIDEKKGRNVATRMGVKVIGTLGVLVLAKEQGVIEAVRPLIEKLERANFRLTFSLKKYMLNRVGETQK